MRIQPMQVAAVAATRVTSCRRRRHGRQDRRTYRGGFASSLVPAGTAGCLPRCERSRARSTHGRPRSRSPAAASRREQASEVVHRDGPRRRAMAGDRSSQRRTRRCRAAPPPSAPALERLGGEVRLRQDQPPVVPAVHDDIAQGAVLDPAPLALDDDHVVQPEAVQNASCKPAKRLFAWTGWPGRRPRPRCRRRRADWRRPRGRPGTSPARPRRRPREHGDGDAADHCDLATAAQDTASTAYTDGSEPSPILGHR
jgi:hypothetical protein